MNLKDKKSNFLIEIRKQHFSNYFAEARRKTEGGDGESYDVEAFEKAFKMLHSNKLEEPFFLYKLKEIRRMSCTKTFFIRNELLSDDFCFFIDEIVLKYRSNDEIMRELTHFLINCFYEENFRIKFAHNMMETLNLIADDKDKEVIDNLLNILLNISSNEIGGLAAIEGFAFNKLSGYLNGDLDITGVDIEQYPQVGTNIMRKVKGLEYHKVRS